jgi:transcription elongation factor Elf1
MSEGWKKGYWEHFKCPLCGSTKYVEVRVQKTNGHSYTTEFYQCFHCTVMFHDPQLFARCDSSTVTDEAIRGPGRIKSKGSAE